MEDLNGVKSCQLRAGSLGTAKRWHTPASRAKRLGKSLQRNKITHELPSGVELKPGSVRLQNDVVHNKLLGPTIIVPAEEAVQIARRVVLGDVAKIHLDVESEFLVWIVIIGRQSSVSATLMIDAGTGQVLAIDWDR